MKKLADRLSVVRIKKLSDVKGRVNVKIPRQHISECDIMENNAFHMIGDDDL